MTILIELTGWIAAAFTLTAYSCRTMLPLRISAVAANVFFATYGALAEIWPTLVLHVALLPLNGYRLWQILDLTHRARAASGAGTEDAFGWIADLQKPQSFAAGSRLFSAGDPADHIYYLVSGRVRLEEIDTTLEPGALFGEIAFFAETRTRTASAVCESDCELVLLDEASFMAAFHQDPAFGLAIVRLVTRRLIANAAQRKDAPAG